MEFPSKVELRDSATPSRVNSAPSSPPTRRKIGLRDPICVSETRVQTEFIQNVEATEFAPQRADPTNLRIGTVRINANFTIAQPFSMGVIINHVAFEHHRDALGIGQDRPRISWRLSGNLSDWTQQAYDIQITRSGHVETINISSHESVLVPWPASPLNPGEAATVLVRSHGRVPGGDVSATPWSEPVAVELGLLTQDWKAELIESTHKVKADKSLQPILFRRCFHLRQAVLQARLYITAHGVYTAEINGREVGDHILAPGWTSYGHRLTYQTFDVTKLLSEGENAIGAYVGAGWYCGRLGFHGGKRNIWGDNIGLFAQLVITFADGNQETVVTDSDWKWSTGPITFSEIYDGEEYDARLELKEWSNPIYNDNKWTLVAAKQLPNKEHLQPPLSPPVRRIQEVPAIEVIKSPSGKTIVDFGQNLVGWLRVRISGPAGHSVSFTHTEVLEYGEAATRPLRMARAKDILTLSSGETQVWEPKFTFHGFRYVEIENWPSKELELADLTAIVVHTDMERTGWFECSHPLLNKLHENVCWSMRGNFLAIPTDCPQRDERLGWTGDLGIFTSTANYLYDTYGILESWLMDLGAEQMVDGSGIPPLVSPDALRSPKKAQAIWGDVVVTAPWDLYQAFNDSTILIRQYESMTAWLDYGVPRDSSGLWDSSLFQLGDWLDPTAPPDEPGNSVTDSVLVANAHLIRSTDLMVKISCVLDRQQDAKRYEDSAKNLRRAFAREYITASGRLVSDSQTAISLALCFSLFQNSAQEARAADRLKQLVREGSRFKIATGFAGTPIVGHALTKVGESQIFYRMLLHKKCPSWLYPITMGATTIWERWDSMMPNGSINPGEMTSFNHYALGAVAHWMHTVIGGISPGTAGWKKCFIRPFPGGDLSHCSVSHLSPYGKISVSWKIEDKELVLNAQIPPNTTAEIKLPGATVGETVGSGEHNYRVAYEAPVWPPLPIYPPFSPHDDDEP